MAWSVRFAGRSEKELDALHPQARTRILSFISTRLLGRDDPRLLGKPMQGDDLKEYWIYRVGDYRLICSFEDEILMVLVNKVGHRRDIYDRFSA